ncbi:MAG: hypothetical protein A2341_14960 [Deltaproteobacteria bacterium RIFOXYB12_FULL_58_9]|nr:MAG: hypothetical protein A2341_14960 [Deltaproteobacteria bacterium RIFOXYB12_FULL_58_9]
MASDQPQFELRTADQILAMPDSGEFLAQFMDDHKKLILDMHQAQMDQGGKVKGGFTITVDYTLDRQLSLIVTAEAKIKAPKKPKASAALWTTADGMLTPQNPRQPSLPGIRDVTPTAQPIRA